MSEQPFISDVVLWTCLERVLDGSARTQKCRNLCINVVLGCVDAPECGPSSLSFPPTSDFDLVHWSTQLPSVIGGTSRLSLATLVLARNMLSRAAVGLFSIVPF